MKRKLGIVTIVTSLISLHYGLGFLIGTSELVYKNGLSGMLYPLMCALGLVCLAFLAPFYWKRKYPIWTLLGDQFGEGIKNITMFLSWVWMMGVIASQVLGAAYILNIINIPVSLSILCITFGITFISLLPINKLAKVLTCLLVVNTAILILAIIKFSSPSDVVYIVQNLPKNMINQSPLSNFGIIFPTLLITVLGMDFHQFIVQSKNVKKAIWGTLIAGFILFFIAFIPTLTVLAAVRNNILPPNIDGKQVIPYVLMYFGSSFGTKIIGDILVLSLLTITIGSGSALTKILINTFSGFDFLPKALKSKRNIIMFNILFILFLAFTGKTIISLIVCFYIIYITGVFFPFLIYFTGLYKKIKISKTAIYFSAVSGSVSSFLILVGSKLNVLPSFISNNLEFSMISIGISVSLLIGCVIYFIKKRDII